MEPVKYRKDRSFEGLLRFIVRIGDPLTASMDGLKTSTFATNLSIGPQNVEKAGDSAQTLIEVMALLERSRDILAPSLKRRCNAQCATNLEKFLILLPVRLLKLLVRGDVVLEVADGMLPRAQALLEELRNLARSAERHNRPKEAALHSCPRRGWRRPRCPGTTSS